MTQNVILFGSGVVSQCCLAYFGDNPAYNILGVVVDDKYSGSLDASNQKITKPPPIYKDKILMKRLKLIHRITHELGSVNPFTTQAALTYSQQLSELEDCDTLDSSTQALCDCVVLAHQFFEKDIWSLREIEQLDSGIFRDFDWSASTYVDTEATLFMLLDYCLYPREIVQLER